MGLFGKAMIDCVEWQPQSNDIYAYKFPEDNISSGAQVNVHESQEAVFCYRGQFVDKLGPGHHSLKTANLPILRGTFGLPFGGKNPLTAQIWFVNKAAPLTIDFKTTPMNFMDPDYGQMIPLVTTGRYGLKVKAAEKFLGKLVGTVNQFTTADLKNHFMGPLVAKTNSLVNGFMSANQVGISQIAAHLDQLSTYLKEPLKEFWDEYGVDLTDLYITAIDLDQTTEQGKKIAAAFTDRATQNIAGYTWQQKQGFDAVNNAVSNSKGGLGMIGAAMMMGGGIGGGGGGAVGAGMMNPTQQAPSRAPGAGMQRQMGNGVKEVFCSNCGKKYPNTSRFCPFCGDPYNPCPVCGNDNSTSAKRCSVCGSSLAASNNIAGMVQGSTCSRCGTAYQPGTKFCNVCGNKLI
ncbi:MAG: SPFH domain-containing protein [Treponema sp.]|nr:SPFH domain-containing protein [Treponema sp.]